MTKAKLTFLLAGLLAWPAAATEMDLEKQAEREARWSKISVALPGVSGPVAALRTEGGALRLLEIGDRYVGALTVSGKDGSFRWVRSQRQLQRACESLSSVVDLELERRNQFSLKLFANPLNSEAVRQLGFENKIYETQVEAVLSFKDGAEPLVTKPRLSQLQIELNQLVKRHATEVLRSGFINLKWAGVDDLICDLLSGQVKLDVKLLARFESAELRRKEVLSAEQVLDLQRRLQVMPVGEQSPGIRLLSRTANLGSLLQQDLGSGFSGFMQTKFYKLHGQLIALANGEIVPLDPASAARVARRLDELSVGQDINQSVISAAPEWDFLGENL